jgi:filamentous hemagglutinin family protein
MKLHLYTSILALIISPFIAKTANAQIVPDQTLPSSSQVQNGCTVCEINGGTTRGVNLYHSFQQFSVLTNGQALFNNSLNIENIITRVTGNSLSNIDGLIRTNGTANLFLINPNGIIFGENARLNIGGSFIPSTANSIKFADGTEFNTQTSQNTPLLTITAPIGLQFGNNPGTIQVQTKNGLQVQPNQTLALVGGDINLEGTTLGTAGGRIELGSVKEASLVNLTSINQGFLLGFDGVKNFGDIQLAGGTNIDTSSIAGGEIRVNSRNLRMIEDSRMTSLNLGSVPGGAMTINATDTVEVIGTGEFETAFGEVINPAANPANRRNGFFAVSLWTGSGGNFEMNTGKLSLKNGAFILISAFGEGKGGDVNINASKSVEVIDSLLATGNRAGSTGDAGDIKLNTQNLILQNRGLLGTPAFGDGKAGNLTINAAESIDMSGGETFTKVVLGGGINTSLNSLTLGASDGGDLTINTKRLTLSNEAQIGTGTFAGGNGGNLTVNADSIELIGKQIDGGRLLTGIAASSNPGSTGNAGNLTINTKQLTLSNIAYIDSGTFTGGNGGNLTINADSIKLISNIDSSNSNTGINTSSTRGSTGNAGNLTINTHTLQILNGAYVSASTGGSGNAGNLTVNASDIQLIGTDGIGSSGLFARSRSSATGAAGDIKVTTNTLQIRDGGTITVEGGGSGIAGNLSVDSKSIILDNSATITANTRSNNTEVQQQASINLNSQDLIMRRGSSITTNATGNNVNGGNITINTDVLAALENSDISANSTDSRGGRVTITAQGIFGTEFRPQPTLESDITATGGNPELSGTVEINRLSVDPNQGLINLSTGIIDTENQLAQGCAAGSKFADNEFTIIGRGGLPSSPEHLFIATNPLVDLVELVPNQESNKSIQPAATNTNLPSKIVEAQGWVIDAQGNINLVAQVANAVPHNPIVYPVSCSQY